jgi:hypothetical protein
MLPCQMIVLFRLLPVLDGENAKPLQIMEEIGSPSQPSHPLNVSGATNLGFDA